VTSIPNPPGAWTIGDHLPPLDLPPVDRLSLIRYAAASGDFNPIHLVDEDAERAGLPGIIQHGMLTMAQLGALFTPWLAEGFIESFQTRFTGMLALGESLRLSATVTAIENRADGDRVTFTIDASTTDGRPIATGTLEFRRYAAPAPDAGRTP
jgi:acyl dehydratase